MKVLLKKELKKNFEEIDVEDNISLEELFLKYKEEFPYTPMAAKVDNKIEPLNSKVKAESKVEFIDMRSQSGNLIYQQGLTLVYLKAIYDVLGEVEVDIHNSLNKGLYTEIQTEEELTNLQLQQINRAMRYIVDSDIPIFKKGDNLYEISGYSDTFYDMMVPSTGYLDIFEIMKYKKGILLRFPHPSDPSKVPAYIDEKKIYEAFAETAKWQKLLGIQYAKDLNEKIRKGEMKEIIQLSEALHEKRIVEIAEQIIESNKRIILIAGPSSSGKTTFARRLCIQLKVNGKNPLYLGTDDYFLNREDTPEDENGEKDFESLSAVDVALFNDQMNGLLKGENVDLPEFDFLEGKKIFGKRITQIDCSQPIVIEGIHALNSKLTKYIDDEEKFRIYISPLTGLNIDRHNRIPTTDERMLRRLVRDYKYRGKSAENTIKNWPKVRAGEDVNIFPYSGMADAFFNSVHIYEVAILKKYAKPLLEAVSEDAEEFSEARRMLKLLEFFEEFEDDDIVVNTSILREFIGGSVFA